MNKYSPVLIVDVRILNGVLLILEYSYAINVLEIIELWGFIFHLLGHLKWIDGRLGN